MCSAVRGWMLQGEHVCESTLGAPPWGYPNREERVINGGTRENPPGTKVAWEQGPAYTDLRERHCQSKSIFIPSLPHAYPNALQKSSRLSERPWARHLQPSSHPRLHTPPTLVQLKPMNLQVEISPQSFIRLFELQRSHSLPQRCMCDMHATYECLGVCICVMSMHARVQKQTGRDAKSGAFARHGRI